MIDAHRVWMIAGGFSPRTIVSAVQRLDRLDRDLAGMHADTDGAPLGLAGAYPDELATWLATDGLRPRVVAGVRAPSWSAQTKATYRQHVRRFYEWACDPDDPWLSYDPSVRLRRPKVNKPVPAPTPQAQVEQILATADDPWWLHCLLAAKVGMRPIEIAAAQREDFTGPRLGAATGWVRIPHGKGDKPATLPLDPQVWEVVRSLPPGPITRMICGRPATANWVSRLTAQYLRRIGIPTSLRYLRHYFATYLLDHGATMREVQQLMRHESIETTAGYTAVTETRLQAVILTLPRFDVSAAAGPGGRPAAAA